MKNPIKIIKSPDGTYEMSYFDKIVGWSRKAKYPSRPGVILYRAVSVHGEIRHCYSLKTAKAALLEMYH